MSTARALRRTEKLDLRLTSTAKQTLEAAAEAVRSSVSAFVLDSALSRADEALADRSTFVISKAQFAKFQAALDAPARPLPRMQRLLTEPGFFDPVPPATTPKGR